MIATMSIQFSLDVELSCGIPRGVVANVLYYDFVVSEFELQSRYFVFRLILLRNVMKPLTVPLAMGQIVLLLFFYKNGFGIELHRKVDMPSNKETKPNQTK